MASPTHAKDGWRANILRQLQVRNSSQIDAYKTLLQRHAALLHRNQQLEKELKLLRMEQRGGGGGSGVNLGASVSGVAGGGGFNDAEVARLKEELTVCYKRLSDNAGSVIELTAQVKAGAARLKEKEQEIEECKRQIAFTTERISSLTDESSEKDLTIQILQEELKALQIELVKSEEKASRISAENSTLVARWVQKMQEEADLLNETNARQGGPASGRPGLPPGSPAGMSRTLPLAGGLASSLPVGAGNPAAVSLAAVPSRAVRTVAAHQGEATCVAYDRRGQQLGTCANDRNIALWAPSNLEPRGRLTGPSSYVTHISFGHELVLAASNDNLIRTWALPAQRLRSTLTGHLGRVTGAHFSPDSQRVLSCSVDRTIRFWDLAKGFCARTLFAFSACTAICSSFDGAHLVSAHADGALRFWDIRAAQVVKELPGVCPQGLTSVALNPSNQLLVTCRDHSLQIFDLASHACLRTLRDDAFRVGVSWLGSCWSPDGAAVASGGADGTVLVWNASSGQLLRSLASGHKAAISAVAWNPSAAQLASVDKEGHLVMWE